MSGLKILPDYFATKHVSLSFGHRRQIAIIARESRKKSSRQAGSQHPRDQMPAECLTPYRSSQSAPPAYPSASESESMSITDERFQSAQRYTLPQLLRRFRPIYHSNA